MYPFTQKAASVIKNQLIEADQHRKGNQALTELELEAQEHAQSLVERAAEMRLEQEEEIQKLNKVVKVEDSVLQNRKKRHKLYITRPWGNKQALSLQVYCSWMVFTHLTGITVFVCLSRQLILDVKCKAALDAQIEEKKQIHKEFAEEEMRLDTIMEVERRRALDTEEQIRELRRQQRFR